MSTTPLFSSLSKPWSGRNQSEAEAKGCATNPTIDRPLLSLRCQNQILQPTEQIMLENPSQSDPPSNSTSAPIKRYAPPNQRHRSLNRRKSGEKTSSHHGGDDKSVAAAFRSAPLDARASNSVNDSLRPRVVSLNGCSRSEAAQLLHDRWEATINFYNDPEIDLSERPVVYTSSPASAWTNFRPPHQLITGLQMDFLGQLHRELQNHKLNTTR